MEIIRQSKMNTRRLIGVNRRSGAFHKINAGIKFSTYNSNKIKINTICLLYGASIGQHLPVSMNYGVQLDDKGNLYPLRAAESE